MRKFKLWPCLIFAALLSLFVTNAHAQSHPPADWVHVQGLLPGTLVQVRTHTAKEQCNLTKADADSLTCVTRYGGKTLILQRADIVTVKTNHRAKSTLIGLGIGTAGGALFGVAVGRNGSFVGRGAASIIFAIPGAIIGTVIGAVGNFAHTLIYQAP